MKLAILCSSLEPGRDGVGDYSLHLATALQNLGHSILIIALNDRHLGDVATIPRVCHSGAMPTLRLPANLLWPDRIERARKQIERFDPEWVSLQFVPYGFHSKGLVHGLGRKLDPLLKGRRLQIMVHELWIGGSSWKHRLVGPLQRYFIKRLFLALQPRLLQTSMPLFQARLSAMGFEASVLPLAGNIPVNPDPGLDWFLEVLGQPEIPVAPEKRAEYLVGGFFGAIYSNWEPEPFFSSLRNVARTTGQKVSILAAGRMSGRGEATWNRLPPAYRDFNFHKLGELPAGRVSQYLQNLDFGIAVTPWWGIGKSGAAAAMLDHGLPVMVTRNDAQPLLRLRIDPPADPLLILADRDVSDRFFAGLPRRAPLHSARNMAVEFVRQMEQAQSAPVDLVDETIGKV